MGLTAQLQQVRKRADVPAPPDDDSPHVANPKGTKDPRLVRAGHEVVNISRGQRSAYLEDEAWQHVRHVPVDRVAEDRAGTFGDRVAALHPDVVIDMVCFTPESATALVDRLRGEVGHLVHCGSI